MGDVISTFFTELPSRVSGGSEFVFYMCAIPIALFALFIARYFIRASVNQRVKAVESSTVGFMGLAEMRKKGLITEEEYRKMRKKVATQVLEEQKEEAEKATAAETLMAIEADPALAEKLIPKSNPRARAAVAGIGKRDAPPAPIPPPTKPPEIPTLETSEVEHLLTDPVPREMPLAKPPNGARPPIAQRPSPIEKPATPSAAPPPRPTPRAAPAPPPAARSTEEKVKDLDQLLSRGLITREEHDRLARFVRPER